MQNARDTGRTRADTIPDTSRRFLLAGGAAAALVGAAIASQAKGATGADAELIALADQIMAEHAEMDRRQEEADAAGRDDWQFYRDVVQPASRRCWDMRARLAAMPATTLEGFRAKARVVQAFNNCIGGGASAYSDDAMAWSLANDLLGVRSVFEAEEGENVA